nr:putative ribonuclease H-like domain-containing protein [Tanacetum cinerariifolium]
MELKKNGNSFKPVAQTTTNDAGTSTTHILGPVTTEKKAQKKNDVKARSMLLMPKLQSYGSKSCEIESKNASKEIPNELKESHDAPLVKDRVSDNKDCLVESPIVVEKKTFVPTVAKIEFVKAQQQEKLVRKPVKEMVVSRNNFTRVNYTNSTRKNPPNTHKKNAPRAVLMKTGLRPLNTARLVNTAHPKTTVHSARPILHFSKSAESTVKRPYQQKTSFTNKSFRQTVNTARPRPVNTTSPRPVNTVRLRPVNTARPNSAVVNAVRCHQQQVQEDQGICYLWEGVNGSRITGKGTLKIDHLGKFDGKADKGYFVGYSMNNKAFRVYNIRTRRVEENLHIEFLENKPIVAGAGPKWLFNIDMLTESMNNVPGIAGTNSNDFVGCFTIDSSSKNATNDKPQSYCDAGNKDDNGVNKDSGIDAHEKSANSINDINTIGPSINTASTDFNTGSLNINTNSPTISTASPEATHGYIQEEGIDYDEVFALVARIKAIRLFLTYASFMGFMVYQMDVKSDFLYERIEEEVYVFQPPGFEDPDHPEKVYKVMKALYGLHQAPRAWYETLANYLLSNGLHKGKIDQTLFIKRQNGDILLVHVYEEPKKIFDAFKDPSWVEAMQEELLQFKIQNVWILVDCPKG